MDLNISTQINNDFQGNNNIKENTSNKTEFNGIFDVLEGIEEDVNIDIEKDDESAIDCGSLQNLLINFIDFREVEKLNKDASFDLLTDSSDGLYVESTDNQLELLIQIGKISKDNETYGNFINNNMNLKNNQNNELKLENDTLYEFITENVINEEIGKLEIGKIKDILNKNQNIEVEHEGNIEDISDSVLNIESKISDEMNSLIGYKELEVSSLANKANVESDFSKLDINDKELSTLEGILETNDFSFLNNNANTVSSQSAGESTIKEVPISDIRQEFIGEDVVKTIRYLKSNGVEEIKIKISPRELGDMTIKLIRNNEDTKVVITLSKEDVFDLVNKNIGDITKHLSEMDIKVKEISVDIKSDNQKNFSGDLNQEFNRKNQENNRKKNKFKNTDFEIIEANEEIINEEENINILI